MVGDIRTVAADLNAITLPARNRRLSEEAAYYSLVARLSVFHAMSWALGRSSSSRDVVDPRSRSSVQGPHPFLARAAKIWTAAPPIVPAPTRSQAQRASHRTPLWQGDDTGYRDRPHALLGPGIRELSVDIAPSARLEVRRKHFA